MSTFNLRIYGDNILECEKTLDKLYSSLYINESILGYELNSNSSLYCPIYQINTPYHLYSIQLFPGYERWSTNIFDKIRSLGASIIESPDSIITRVSDTGNEEILLALEYCGALPAGNNAWQRSGRALMCAESGIPFLYYSELGGAELDADRNTKSSRLPNPLIPLSYITVNQNYRNAFIVPIYESSPTITNSNNYLYNQCFNQSQDLHLIYAILSDNTDTTHSTKDILLEKAFMLVKILISSRKSKDMMLFNKILEFYSALKSTTTHSVFESVPLNWSKKISISTTSLINSLHSYCSNNGSPMGCSSMPFVVLSGESKRKFCNFIAQRSAHTSSYSDSFITSLKPLAVVWVAGFKPRGDDSRPDRGLLPLFKMLFGNEYEVLTIVYGPMKSNAIDTLYSTPTNLTRTNKLWRAIFTQSDYVLVDNYSVEDEDEDDGANLLLSQQDYFYDFTKVDYYSPCGIVPNFGEHDVDTIIHSIFKTTPTHSTFECLCNPPGGDWSGIKLFNYITNNILRWSSLPRVSVKNKRPDHLIQFGNDLLVIESKFTFSRAEHNIGSMLIKYCENIFAHQPNSISMLNSSDWLVSDSFIQYSPDFVSRIFSVAAFNFSSIDDMVSLLDFCKTEFIFSIEFLGSTKVNLYILGKNSHLTTWLKNALSNTVYNLFSKTTQLEVIFIN